MTTYTKNQKVYLKSTNSTKKITNRYKISLIAFTIITILINLIFKNHEAVISLIKAILITTSIAIIVSYIINIIKKEYQFIKVFEEKDIISLAIIIGLFASNIDNIIVIIIASSISVIIQKLFKNINYTAALYGVLIIMLYRYMYTDFISPLNSFKVSDYTLTLKELIKLKSSKIDYLFGLDYLSPVLSLIILVYLFIRKSIKYNLVFTYLITVFVIMFAYGITTDFNYWFAFFEILTGSLLFLTVYTLQDFGATPTLSEGNIIYGILLGIITSILRFIVPELAVIITIILGNMLLVKPIDNLSIKLKYHKRICNIAYISCIIMVIITIISLKMI